MTTSSKPKVLRIGKVDFAQKKWDELSQIAEVVQCESKNREEFFQDLKTKYSDITSITRTFPSISETGRFDEELASHLPKSVKTLSHCGAGYDQIDVQPFSDRGIQVSNVTAPVEAPTADTAMFLVLAASRNFLQGRDPTVKGEWPAKGKSAGAPLGHDPEGKTVGILGMGGIGRAIRDRLKPFGYERMIYHNRSRLSKELEKDTEYVTLDELISESDIICISIPLNPKTTGLINKSTIEKMKDGVVIVNTARGAIINEADITQALKDGKIGAFGSDVFTKEPEVAQELLSLPNVVALPHMGTHTYEAIFNMESWVVANVESYFKTGEVKTIVPEQWSLDLKGEPLV
ncbi:glyoxylate reductase 1 [[Candida] railenensis]|uniref:Glyoxylate reductase 1 n=1 Tax=[Candida] railenensis TaxID=45579 RepID=A0A9P0VWH4_9ASCO|nr:glyoxylate reductase 1 [[Candida] railenensis]